MYTLLSIVEEKLNHIQHRTMGSPLRTDHMLALVLYTSCDSNYDLCKHQRTGNYTKWCWFDYCLFEAITKLSRKETGSYKLYTGLSGVKIDKKEMSNVYFPTYVSTSWVKEVSIGFMEGDGMIIELDEKFRSAVGFNCARVSWISKFEDECEVLIARSRGNTFAFGVNFVVVDEIDGVQTVSATINEKYGVSEHNGMEVVYSPNSLHNICDNFDLAEHEKEQAMIHAFISGITALFDKFEIQCPPIFVFKSVYSIISSFMH